MQNSLCRFFLSAGFEITVFSLLFYLFSKFYLIFLSFWCLINNSICFSFIEISFFWALNVDSYVILFSCHICMRRRWKQEYYKLQQRLELNVDQFRPLLHMLDPSWMSENRRKKSIIFSLWIWDGIGLITWLTTTAT